MTTSYRPDVPGAPTLTPAPPGASDAGVDERLVEAARQLAPLIRAHADEAERERRIARPVLDALADAGLRRLFAPRAYGGLEADPVTCARAVEEIALADSAAGWAMQAGNTGAWWAARLPAEGAAELFAGGPEPIIAASFQAMHRVTEVPGGYRFTGRGALASTVHDAQWVMMAGLVMDDGRPRMTEAGPEIVAVAMSTGDVEIVDSWHSLGMRGTDSNDVVADDVHVPASRAFHMTPTFRPGPGYEGPLYRIPAVASVSVVVAPVALAIARNAITALRELAQQKTAMGTMKTLRDRAVVQATLAEAEGILRAARLLFYDELAAAWRRAVAGETATLEQRADLMLAGAHAARSAARVADLMHRLGGTSGIYARSPLERHFRDAQTVRHHGFLSDGRLETVGQVYLGVAPEFPLVAF
ncbi:MAG TPA: acyl-CoA dehydrogenase family protein [Gemmatimonadaceae bacterium]|nr:acyl-CoA dehydrogenase family protein [Gemmatimonadaceae bacterium]